ncbi:MAG TPA: type IV pilin protein [Steroidobacteraceae bacterium]|nr:type IV pilin protein [Steroidobacteraceae bacterium]
MFVRGVTLLEILVVLLVVGIIAALAMPSYRQHMVRVNRTEATSTLYEIASAEERHYLHRGSYTSDVTGAPPEGLGLARDGAHRYEYTVSIAGDGQSFIARATPVRDGGQDSDAECLGFSLDHRGRRAVSGSRDTSSCWR